MKLLSFAMVLAACGSRTGLALTDSPGTESTERRERFLAVGWGDDFLSGLVEVTESGELSFEVLGPAPVEPRATGSAVHPLLLGERQWEPFIGDRLEILDPATLAFALSVDFDTGVNDSCMVAEDLVYLLDGQRFVLMRLSDGSTVSEFETGRTGTAGIVGRGVGATSCMVLGDVLYVGLGLYDESTSAWLAALDTRTNTFLDLAPDDPASEVVSMGGPPGLPQHGRSSIAKPKADPTTGRLFWLDTLASEPALVSSFDPATGRHSPSAVALQGWRRGRVSDLEMVGSDRGIVVVGSDSGTSIVGFDATTGQSWTLHEYSGSFLVWEARAAFGEWVVVLSSHWLEVLDLETGARRDRLQLEPSFGGYQLFSLAR